MNSPKMMTEKSLCFGGFVVIDTCVISHMTNR